MEAGIGKAQSGGALASMPDRTVDLLKGLPGEDAVVADALDFEQPAIRAEADFSQFRQVVQSFTDAEVVGVVDPRVKPEDGLGAQARCSL